MTKKLYIFLSDGYKGGNTNFIEQNIQFISNNKKKVLLIDKNPKQTFQKLKKSKYLKIIKLDIFKENNKVKKVLRNFETSNHFFFFTNFKILVYYFLFFYKYKKKDIKLAMALHSGVFKFNFKIILGLFVFSILSLKLDYLIYGSNSSKKWWLKFFPWMKLINYKIIFNGVKQNKIKERKKTHINVSFIGRLELENDLKLFLDICFSNKDNKNLKFNIFGDGTLVETIKYNNNVKFWGWVKKEKIYNNTDITLITSPINNFPYVALESSSYGIPVITAAKGDIRKIIKNNFSGYIFDDRTVKNFNFYIDKTIKNYKFLSDNSLINAKKFDIEKSYKKIWSFLK